MTVECHQSAWYATYCPIHDRGMSLVPTWISSVLGILDLKQVLCNNILGFGKLYARPYMSAYSTGRTKLVFRHMGSSTPS